MAILIDPSKRVIVQGITGREGMTRTRLMKNYHTQIVGGVTPGKGGQTVEGVPTFDTVGEARDALGDIDVSVLFIPATGVKDAALEAISAGVKLLVIVPDRVPVYDVLAIDSAAKAAGARFIGPNTLGILSPDKGVLGMMGGQAASAREWFFPGPVGITSRSGGMTTSIAYYLARAGLGASTLVHVGGDAIVGMPHADVLAQFEADPQTEIVVLFGEIGTSQEEAAATLIEQGKFTKPLVAYIGGKAVKSGTRFSHAGAIIEGNRGTREGKVERLKAVGAHVVEAFGDVPRVTAEVLKTGKHISIPPKSTLATIDQRASKSEKREDDLHWTTAITKISPNEILLRGRRIDKLMGELTFSQAIYLALTGRLPSEAAGKVLDAIFVSSVDHGATPPSALAARTSASTGAPMNAAIAAGLLSINKHHGGAIEDCMRLILSGFQSADRPIADAAAELVAAYQRDKKRLPGLGHRVHTDDPRTVRLLEMAKSLGVAGKHVAMIEAIAAAYAQSSGRRLPVNVDGAIAAILLDLGIAPELGNTFFMIARVPGLVAHVHEEMTRQRPMRRIHPSDHAYDGPIED